MERGTQTNSEQTLCKFVGDKIITYYTENGSYCLVTYDTITKKASQPLARAGSREEIERLVANYLDGSEKVSNRKMKEMFVPGRQHEQRPRGPERER